MRQTHDRSYVSRQLEQKAGHPLDEPRPPGEVRLPEGIALDRGLSEDEAVAIALWNNAAFEATLADLGFARADLAEAGLLENPILSLLFPVGPKQLEFSLTWPLAALWQRPHRVAAAKLDAERVAERLVQEGLNLVAAVRLAFAELALAEDRARLAAEAARVLSLIDEITGRRFEDGDISEVESLAARATALRARDEAAHLAHEVTIAAERLRVLLGLEGEPAPAIRPAAVVPGLGRDLEGLLATASAARPELRAAELAIEAAGERAGWERSRVVSLAGILDANAKGSEGFEMGPGVALELPVVHRNRARVERTRAEMEQAARRYVEVRRRVGLEVREARIRLLQAGDALEAWRARILPALEEAQGGAERSYALGDTSYLFVLQSSRELLAGRQREAELTADVRRATARLEQSVGGRP